ncbi:MAG TPA: tRNA (adenosine(37)-N6)-threonylcarbamoyltransferase complex ATPase subunit type 1 TsaE [Beutenbergiaceae bacterium]|nr:tRNA (adenosine(37)-N6)-threonylcarbamoyltransferase complex ATPase subunit type 1 TsaE [Beutenbergiaceae bacterium]
MTHTSDDARDGEQPHPEPAPAWQVQVDLPTAAATTDLGWRLAAQVRAGDLIVLSGGLGAGKTTLTQGIGAGLNVRGQVASPTFIIARSHRGPASGPGLVHVDAYRLASLAEVDDLDLDTSMAESVTVVEWGTGFVEELAAARLEIELLRTRGAQPTGEPGSDEPRTAQISAYGSRWAGIDPTEVTG